MQSKKQKCRGCKEVLPFEFFSPDHRTKTGRKLTCTPCVRKKRKGAQLAPNKRCNTCGELKPRKDFYDRFARCKVCVLEKARLEKTWRGKQRDRAEYHRKYRETRYVAGARKRAARKGIPFSLTAEAVARLRSSPCVYCGGKDRVGVDRVDNSGGYEEGNCAPCCVLCNRAKGQMTVAEFKSFVERIASRFAGGGVLDAIDDHLW